VIWAHPNVMNYTTSTFSLLPKRYSPAHKSPGAKVKGKRQLTMPLLVSAKTAARYRSVVAGGKKVVDRRPGLLLMDDTSLDKPHVQKVEMVTYHWCAASTFRPSFGPMGKFSSSANFGSVQKFKKVRSKTAIFS